MKKIYIPILFIFSLLLTVGTLQAQPFADEIAAFKKQDSVSLPPRNAILFVGSSSFRMWTDVQDYFPSYKIINRGFGGSTLPDVIRYVNDIIFPYHPKQIVIYCGENDFASSDSVTAVMVCQRFTTLFNLIRAKMPKVPVIFIAIKPSPSRWHLRGKMQKGNELIRNYLKTRSKTTFVNVWPAMLKADGIPMDDIYKEDNLHMNAKGYGIWKRLLEPYLLK